MLMIGAMMNVTVLGASNPMTMADAEEHCKECDESEFDGGYDRYFHE